MPPASPVFCVHGVPPEAAQFPNLTHSFASEQCGSAVSTCGETSACHARVRCGCTLLRLASLLSNLQGPEGEGDLRTARVETSSDAGEQSAEWPFSRCCNEGTLAPPLVPASMSKRAQQPTVGAAVAVAGRVERWFCHVRRGGKQTKGGRASKAPPTPATAGFCDPSSVARTAPTYSFGHDEFGGSRGTPSYLHSSSARRATARDGAALVRSTASGSTRIHAGISIGICR